MIIFLNGASSSGKSTVAREMMRLSERPYLYYSVDHLVDFWLDEKFIAFEGESKDWFYHHFMQDEAGNDYAQIVDGPHAIQLHWDMIDALIVFIQKGYDLIIDEVLWQAGIFQRYIPALCGANRVYLVKITCDLIECEKREAKREDRFKGLARTSYAQVYGTYPTYDLEIDTTYTAAPDCAKAIFEYVEKNLKPQAFLHSLPSEITFQPLQEEHFSLLQQWLNSPHVAEWWGEKKMWSAQAISEKYQSYTQGYKLENGEKKSIASFIILCAQKPIGYIQLYNAKDFPRAGYLLPSTTPTTVGAIDLYLGEISYINKGIASICIEKFLEKFVWQNFSACFVDPDTHNLAAIRAYEKSGFKAVKYLTDPPVTLMIKERPLQK